MHCVGVGPGQPILEVAGKDRRQIGLCLSNLNMRVFDVDLLDETYYGPAW